MPRRSRQDFPGAWHHVMNRGQASRPVFKTRGEVRFFLSRLAREVRRGEIEVFAFCVMTTHFHLLLRSPRGQLSAVMKRVENPFVRWFNRKYQRDGALFRGRFTSRSIASERYRHTVRRYIDQNPVGAGMARDPAEYPHGSAKLIARGKVPRWLNSDEYPVEATSSTSPGTVSEHAAWVVERRLERQTEGDPLDELLAAAPDHVRGWLEANARVADGPRAAPCLASPRAVRQAITELHSQHGEWSVRPRSQRKDGWRVLELGLGRDIVGLSTVEASLEFGVARSSAGHALLEHRRLLVADESYRERAAAALARSLSITYGETGGSARDDRARLELVRDRA